MPSTCGFHHHLEIKSICLSILRLTSSISSAPSTLRSACPKATYTHCCLRPIEDCHHQLNLIAAHLCLAPVALVLAIPQHQLNCTINNNSIHIIDELVKSGKELEAVCFACESGLSEKFAPAPLLKNYLLNAKKKSQTILKNGNHSVTAVEESSNVELNSIRSLIKCVEYYELESKFNIDGPKKRLTNLEKAKAERKKSAAAAKSQTKRVRPAGSASIFRPSKVLRTAGGAYAASFHYPSAAHQLPPTRYNYPIQGGGYDGSGPATYGAAHSRSPSTIRQQYYGGPSAVNYSGYDYGAPHTAPAQPQYPH